MAFVLSSVSGNLISAASAGYAPTNSGDVSAIASAYQVVSATGTQLYAGTTYVTSVNEAPISADRAGRAGNATLATSAYYDTNARFISALPDSAAVSAIASAYSESAASSKQDTLAFAYNAADQISSINGSALGGMDEAAVSGIASAYAQSAASSKLDTSAFNSGDFYSTSNPSGFITGVDLTPYQPTSAMSAYATTAYVTSGLSGKENVFSAGTGLEFVQSGSDRVLQVEAPVDIVAGPGIVIDNPDGNTLRVSVAHLDDWEDVSSEITKNTTIITGGSITFRYNKAMKMISMIGEIHVQGAGVVYTLPEKYRPQTNFTCSNPGATSYIDYTPSNGKFVARSGANGYFSWTMTMPCLGE